MCACVYMFSQFISSMRRLGGRQFLCGRKVTNSVASVLASHGSQSTKDIGVSSSSWYDGVSPGELLKFLNKVGCDQHELGEYSQLQ